MQDQHTPSSRDSCISAFTDALRSIRGTAGGERAWLRLCDLACDTGDITADEHRCLLSVPHKARKPRPQSRHVVVVCERPAARERCQPLYPKLQRVLERLYPPRSLRVEFDARDQRESIKAIAHAGARVIERARWDRLKGSEAISKSVEGASFIHSYLAQVGLPRSLRSIPQNPDGTKSREYAAKHGQLLFSVSAGLFGDEPQPLPYGPKPRLMLLDICTQAVRSKSPNVDLGSSAHEYLRRLGLGWGGGKAGVYTLFRRQATALAACAMRFSWQSGSKRVQFQGMPITAFEAWASDGREGQAGLWPGQLVLSQDFLKNLLGHALPLEQAAYMGLSSSALAMDWYAFLCYYLPRIHEPTTWSWHDLHDALGHGQDFRWFRRASLGWTGRGQSKGALQQAIDAYPAAQVMSAVEPLEDGTGIRFRSAAPAIRRAAI